MPRACIYCGSSAPAKGISHIVPESLGGPASPVAPAGIVCDQCNQYFGQKVESLALRSFPFNMVRLSLGIPSKKNKPFSMPYMLGTIRATGIPNQIGIDPKNEKIAAGFKRGEITRLIVLAEVTEPLAVCRMLLKIGLDLLGKHFYEVAVSDRVKAARTFARQPARGQTWWFMLRSDPSEFLRYGADPGAPPFSAKVGEIGDDVLVLALEMPSASILIPLDSNIAPLSAEDFPEPLFRIIRATC